MGVIFFILNVVFALVIIILVLWTSISAIVSKNPDTRYQPMRDDRGSFIKSQNNLNDELDALGAAARGDGAHSQMSMSRADEEKMARRPRLPIDDEAFESSGTGRTSGTLVDGHENGGGGQTKSY